MQLSELELQHFRNYDQLQVRFNPGVNVLIGENAQGKTNLLEAIHVLALTRSHRTNQDRELVAWEQKTATIKGQVIKQTGRLPLEVQLGSGGKKVKVNHLPQNRLSDYLGQLTVVLFSPEDLALVKGAPALRRDFMNTEFSQMSSRYRYNLSRFNDALYQRNQYLKQLRSHQINDRLLLDVLSNQLATFGSEVTLIRAQLVAKLEQWADPLHSEIAQDKEHLALKYISQLTIDAQTTAADLKEELLEKLTNQVDKEILAGTTLTGPQRDDLQFIVNGNNIQHFGSQGQQRTTALAVKMAEIDLMQEQTGEAPLLLLDDVLSELDDDRQTHLLTAIQDKAQTFLTTTSLSGIARQLIKEPTIYTIQHGSLQKEETA